MNALKSMTAGLAVIALGAGLATATVTPAAAADPGAIIAGVIGGVALGAIVAGAASQNHGYQGYQGSQGYYDPSTGYDAGAPSYRAERSYQSGPGYPSERGYYQAADADEDAPTYRQRCHVRQQPAQDAWGRIVYQPVRVCR